MHSVVIGWTSSHRINFHILYTKVSLTLREEPKPRVFENRVLRKIIGPYREEVAGDWRQFFS
jgi:hypothetical protein